MNATRDDKERPNQRDEGHVFHHRMLEHRPAARYLQHVVRPHRRPQGNRNKGITALPQVFDPMRGQRQGGNEQQEQRERGDQPQGNIHPGGPGGVGK